jgi:hypothetical protein
MNQNRLPGRVWENLNTTTPILKELIIDAPKPIIVVPKLQNF